MRELKLLLPKEKGAALDGNLREDPPLEGEGEAPGTRKRQASGLQRTQT
jgi:hypothetical protein